MGLFYLFVFSVFAAPFSIHTLPDGVPLSHAPYGTFESVLSEKARPYQDRLSLIERKVYGLSQLAEDDEVKQAEAVYYIEHVLMGLFQTLLDLPAHEVTPFEREALLYRTVRIYRNVRFHAERLYEFMIRFIDEALPGSTGFQIREELFGISLYTANGRTDKPLTDSERKTLYDKKLSEFLKAGGSLEELWILTPQTLQKTPRLTKLEYVVRPNKEIWVTEGRAGHLLLARGERVESAGQLIILKNAKGIPSLIIVSNSSGNYKPDLLSAEDLVPMLQQKLELDANRILVTKGEPLSLQTAKVILKGRKIEKERIQSKLLETEEQGQFFLTHPFSNEKIDSCVSALL